MQNKSRQEESIEGVLVLVQSIGLTGESSSFVGEQNHDTHHTHQQSLHKNYPACSFKLATNFLIGTNT